MGAEEFYAVMVLIGGLLIWIAHRLGKILKYLKDRDALRRENAGN